MGGSSKKYLSFEVIRDTGKTKSFGVTSVNSREQLGVVSWYAPWRRYVFGTIKPVQIILDASCLLEIQSFIVGLMEERGK